MVHPHVAQLEGVKERVKLPEYVVSIAHHFIAEMVYVLFIVTIAVLEPTIANESIVPLLVVGVVVSGGVVSGVVGSVVVP